METYAQDAWARRNPRARRAVRPDGLPAPTGYFPDRSWPEQGSVSFSEVYDDQYGPARQETLNGAEKVDQHPYLQVSATITAAPQGARKDGRQDPMEDGPAAPTLRLLNLFYAKAQGTSVTHFLDAPGVRFPGNGSQDGASWTYYQDAKLGLLPYNPPEGGDGEMPDTLRALPPSPPHGWAEQPAMNARQVENAKMRQLKQQKAPHQDRLANSTYAGQTYSARTAHVGARTGGSSPSWRNRG